MKAIENIAGILITIGVFGIMIIGLLGIVPLAIGVYMADMAAQKKRA